MRNIALFLDKDLNQIGNKKFESTDDFITFKKGTFNIRLDAYLYKDKDTAYYAYIYPTDEKLLIDNKEIKINPIIEDKEEKSKPIISYNSARLIKIKEKLEHGDLKLIVGENIIGQLAHIAVMGLKTNWVYIILAIGTGIAIGYGIGVSTSSHTTVQIMNSTATKILSLVL